MDQDLDRHRMGIWDLGPSPADAGEGARLRLAAGRAALTRLVQVTPDVSARPAPDLTLVAGGAFATAPGGAVVLAVADVVRRTGATQVALDHARLLGPLGTIEDPDERRDLVADLADDLLAPLGTLLVAAGMPPRLRGRAATGTMSLEPDGGGRRELSTGELAMVALGTGAQATALLEFRDSARFGRRARRFSVSVSGGLAGVMVDLRTCRCACRPPGPPPGRPRDGARVWPGERRRTCRLGAVTEPAVPLVPRRSLIEPVGATDLHQGPRWSSPDARRPRRALADCGRAGRWSVPEEAVPGARTPPPAWIGRRCRAPGELARQAADGGWAWAMPGPLAPFSGS
jgi:hypothetical protein